MGTIIPQMGKHDSSGDCCPDERHEQLVPESLDQHEEQQEEQTGVFPPQNQSDHADNDVEAQGFEHHQHRPTAKGLPWACSSFIHQSGSGDSDGGNNVVRLRVGRSCLRASIAGRSRRPEVALTGLVTTEALVFLAPPVLFSILDFSFVGIDECSARVFLHPIGNVPVVPAAVGIVPVCIAGGRIAGVGPVVVAGRRLILCAVETTKLGFQGEDLGLLISRSHPFSSFHQSFELVAGQVHEAVDGEHSAIIIIFLFLFNVTGKGWVFGRQVTFEQICKQVMRCLSTSRQLVLGDFDKGIELINVALDLIQLVRERGEMSTKDSCGCLSVNERFSDDDLNQQVS